MYFSDCARNGFCLSISKLGVVGYWGSAHCAKSLFYSALLWRNRFYFMRLHINLVNNYNIMTPTYKIEKNKMCSIAQTADVFGETEVTHIYRFKKESGCNMS